MYPFCRSRTRQAPEPAVRKWHRDPRPTLHPRRIRDRPFPTASETHHVQSTDPLVGSQERRRPVATLTRPHQTAAAQEAADEGGARRGGLLRLQCHPEVHGGSALQEAQAGQRVHRPHLRRAPETRDPKVTSVVSVHNKC